VPSSFNKEFRIELQGNFGPFEFKQSEEWFTRK